MKKIKSFMKNVPWKLRYALIFAGCNLFAAIVYPSLRAYAVMERGYENAVGGEVGVWFIGILAILIIDTIRIGRVKGNETQED